MSNTFKLGSIKSMDDLAYEKKRLKAHIDVTEDQLIDALEKLPASVISKFFMSNAGKAAKMAGTLLIGKALKPASQNIGTMAATALKAKSPVAGLAVNAGVFLAGELVGKFQKWREKRKEIRALKHAKEDAEELAEDLEKQLEKQKKKDKDK